MKDLANNTPEEDLSLIIVTEDELTDFEEKDAEEAKLHEAKLHECQHCGHAPCGCGG